jgi:lipase chaperone LimK
VIALFDYFFSAAGEESDAAIRERIAALAAARLDEPALSEALALLDRYDAYREAGRRLTVPAGASAAERLSAVRELRRRHFGDAADALFGEDERAAEVAIDKSRIAQDETLSPDDRADLLAEADERLPEPIRAARAAAGSVTQLRADEQALRAAGADEAEIHRFRAGTLGPDAADRLDALDRRRAAWKSKIQSVREARHHQCPAAADPAACEAALIEAAFDERERIRARVLLAGAGN